MTGHREPDSYQDGDPVVAVRHIGRLLRRRIRRGTRGIVTGHDPDGSILVVFANDRSARARPTQITIWQPRSRTTR